MYTTSVFENPTFAFDHASIRATTSIDAMRFARRANCDSLSSLGNTGAAATKTYKRENYEILITIKMYNKL
jgi:hypothetical protein